MKEPERGDMRRIMRSKYSFISAFAAIATITLFQLQGFFRSFRGNEVDPTTTLVPHLREPSLRNQSNRSKGLEAEELDEAAGIQRPSETMVSVADPVEVAASGTEAYSGNAATNVTIVCEMSGELGNHLGHIAHCAGIALWLEREHNVSSHIVMRLRQTWRIGRWEAAQKAIRSCFPKLSQYNFKEANDKAFPIRKQQQDKLKLALTDVNSQDVVRVENALLSTTISSVDFLVDRYVDDMRELFVLDKAKQGCCLQLPDPDETVFHFRNFAKELPGRANKLGFQELGPKQTAQELFGHLKQGDKVAIISRFNLEHAKKNVKALTDRGLQVRFIQNQTGIQDFCFLMHAQKEVVGTSVSTYFKWAALLSKATSVVAYSLDVPAQKRRVTYLKRYPFTNPQLAKIWTFRQFRPNE